MSRLPTPEVVSELAAVGVQWMEDTAGAPREYWRNTDALNLSYEIGALAQAIRNYAATRDERELVIALRLANAAIGNPSCASLETGAVCGACDECA